MTFGLAKICAELGVSFDRRLGDSFDEIGLIAVIQPNW